MSKPSRTRTSHHYRFTENKRGWKVTVIAADYQLAIEKAIETLRTLHGRKGTRNLELRLLRTDDAAIGLQLQKTRGKDVYSFIWPKEEAQETKAPLP